MRLRTRRTPGAGGRDHWVTIQQRPDDNTADSGFPTDAVWTDLATIAMAREDIAADESPRNAQEVATTNTQWDMPYMVEMDPERVDVMKLRRLMYLGRAFDIIGAIPIGRGETIALLTESFGQIPSEVAS